MSHCTLNKYSPSIAANSLGQYSKLPLVLYRNLVDSCLCDLVKQMIPQQLCYHQPAEPGLEILEMLWSIVLV